MISFILSKIQKLVSGGASYLFIGMGGALLFQHWYIGGLKKDYTNIVTQRDQALEQVQEKNTLIASQARQYSRQLISRKDENHAQKTINSVPDSSHCIESPAISSAIDWLREYEGGAAETDDDKPDVPMPEKARLAE